MIIGNQNPQRSHDPPPKDCFALTEPTRARQYLAFALHCIVEGHYFCVFSVAFVVRILSIAPITSKLAAKPQYPLFRINSPGYSGNFVPAVGTFCRRAAYAGIHAPA